MIKEMNAMGWPKMQLLKSNSFTWNDEKVDLTDIC